MLLSLGLAFTACVHEEDDIFSKSAAERLNEASALYTQRLTAQPNGWAMQYYPTLEDEYPYGNGYLILCRFMKDMSVDVAMNNRFSGNTFKNDTSFWEVITDNGPVLSFNSFNQVMHAFSYPEDIPWTGDKDNANDETGTGAEGDYEFIIVDAPADASYLMLKGKKRGTYNLLTPIEEGVVYKDYLDSIINFNKVMFSESAPTYNVVHFGSKTYKMDGANDGIPNIYPYDGDAIVNESFNPFLITMRGGDYYLRFRDAIEVDGGKKVQDFHYIADEDRFVSTSVADCFITGDTIPRFFKENLSSGNVWELSAKSEMSEQMKQLFDDAAAGFKARSYTLNKVSLSISQGMTKLIVNYKVKANQAKTYNYNYTFTDEGVKFDTLSPGDSSAENMMNSIAGLKPLLEAFATEFVLSKDKTSFSLSTIKFTSKTDSNLWAIMSLLQTQSNI